MTSVVVWLSLALTALWGALGLGVRSWLHARRTGSSPLRRGTGLDGRGVVIGVTAAFLAGPVAEGAFGVKRLVNSLMLSAAGTVVALSALMAVLWVQSAMGASLRIGVDPEERTELVTSGPFGWVRNPIYALMILYLIGTAMMLPNPAAISAVVVLAVAEEVQVRRVEEPYLAAIHGESYQVYVSRVGRFVPGIGRR